MSLAKYQKMRRFKDTPEPKGKVKTGGGQLRFVVQKHQASQLHYDFRLELDGVLKSWAIPKGPSLNPSDKHLAMAVEDHPLDYREFEGIIPEGNYGAGTVIIWDEGTYEPSPLYGPTEGEKGLKKQLAKGDLKFVLHGHKLKGDFALVKMKGRGDNNWLLIKHRDEYAKDVNITTKAKSVKSGKTLEEVAKHGGQG